MYFMFNNSFGTRFETKKVLSSFNKWNEYTYVSSFKSKLSDCHKIHLTKYYQLHSITNARPSLEAKCRSYEVTPLHYLFLVYGKVVIALVNECMDLK